MLLRAQPTRHATSRAIHSLIEPRTNVSGGCRRGSRRYYLRLGTTGRGAVAPRSLRRLASA